MVPPDVLTPIPPIGVTPSVWVTLPLILKAFGRRTFLAVKFKVVIVCKAAEAEMVVKKPGPACPVRTTMPHTFCCATARAPAAVTPATWFVE